MRVYVEWNSNTASSHDTGLIISQTLPQASKDRLGHSQHQGKVWVIDLDTEAKVSVGLAVILVLTAFVDLRISAALATAYLIGYAVNRMRKDRKRKESARQGL